MKLVLSFIVGTLIAATPLPDRSDRKKETDRNPPAGIVVAVTETTFDREVAHATEPVLIQFQAAWCGPCRQAVPILEALAKDYTGRVKIVSIDIDRCPNLSKKFDIQAVPTLILMQQGVAQQQLTGVPAKEKLSQLLENHLKGKR
jgi:thioredoxin